jgi:hypothetical protein
MKICSLEVSKLNEKKEEILNILILLHLMKTWAKESYPT